MERQEGLLVQGYSIRRRWSEEGGYGQVLRLAWPLILSSGSWSLQLYFDRLFLSNYSASAVAAALPAGMVNFTIVSLFLGVSLYTNVFVAQYIGAERPKRVGPAVWQGMYIALFAAVFGFAVRPFSSDFFAWVGHDPAVLKNEIVYFNYLVYGIGPAVVSSAASCFFTGRGKALVVMVVNFIGTGVNIFFNYVLIFGHLGFPELGMKGAALGTVFSQVVSCALFLTLLFLPSNRRTYDTLRGCRWDWDLFRRMLKFGLPNGVQFALDNLSFTAFVMLFGRLGETQLAAGTVTLSINALAFLPMIGFGIAVSTLVGQRVGQNRTDLAEKSAYSAFHMTSLYMVMIGLCYVLVPDFFARRFGARLDPVQSQEILSTVRILLRFTAFYCLFDTMSIVFAAAIKGAGDTRFAMLVMVTLSWILMVLPTYLVVFVFHWGLLACWSFFTAYIVILGFVFLWRFRGGKWKSMRVIETPPPASPPTLQAGMMSPDGETPFLP
jgi:MATE family multidrug resistance protein